MEKNAGKHQAGTRRVTIKMVSAVIDGENQAEVLSTTRRKGPVINAA